MFPSELFFSSRLDQSKMTLLSLRRVLWVSLDISEKHQGIPRAVCVQEGREASGRTKRDPLKECVVLGEGGIL